MKTIIAGSRTMSDSSIVADAIKASGFRITEVISGGAPGVDALAEKWAEQHGIPVVWFPADWKRYGRKAGPIRNQAMAEYGEALVAVWDGKSRGTKNMIRLARKHGLRVFVYHVNTVNRDHMREPQAGYGVRMAA